MHGNWQHASMIVWQILFAATYHPRMSRSPSGRLSQLYQSAHWMERLVCFPAYPQFVDRGMSAPMAADRRNIDRGKAIGRFCGCLIHWSIDGSI
eukprot:scaffold291107_cov18-Prasinocladus_malaysianus.AAC.1